MGGALIADSFEAASRIAPTIAFPVATLDGDVFYGRHVVTGGEKAESRGILATKREIKELRQKITEARASLDRLGHRGGRASSRRWRTRRRQSPGSPSEIHRQEKAIVIDQGQVARGAEDEARVQQRVDLVGTEVRGVREEMAGLDLRQEEARESIVRLNEQKITEEIPMAGRCSA